MIPGSLVAIGFLLTTQDGHGLTSVLSNRNDRQIFKRRKKNYIVFCGSSA